MKNDKIIEYYKKHHDLPLTVKKALFIKAYPMLNFEEFKYSTIWIPVVIGLNDSEVEDYSLNPDIEIFFGDTPGPVG